MNMSRLLLCPLVIVLISCSTAPAADTAKPPTGRTKVDKPRFRGAAEYDRMVEVLIDLTDKQKAELKSSIILKTETLKKQQPRYDELMALRKAEKKARASGDKDAANAARDKIQAIYAEQKKLMLELNASVQAVLTADQRNVWQGYILRRSILRRLRPASAKLTDDQKANIKQACEDAAEEIAALAKLTDKEKMKAAKKEIRKKLDDDILRDILTAAQRQAVEKRRADDKKKRAERYAKKKAAKEVPADANTGAE